MHTLSLSISRQVVRGWKCSPSKANDTDTTPFSAWDIDLVSVPRVGRIFLVMEIQTFYVLTVMGNRQWSFKKDVEAICSRILEFRKKMLLLNEDITLQPKLIQRHDKRRIGTMNSFVYEAPFYFTNDDFPVRSLVELEGRLNQTPVGALDYQSPVHAIQKFLPHG